MCCCIPLRTLSHFGAILHMGMGIYFLYLLGSVSYTLYSTDVRDSASRRYMGFLYIAYYAAFLPPGIFIFWGVQKKIRRFLVWPSLAFLLIQLYSIGLQSTYGYRPQNLPEAMKHTGSDETYLKKLRMGFWIDIFGQLLMTISYMFMIFFYVREISEESPPVQSRYAQQAFIQHTMCAVAAHHQHQQQQAAALAFHRSHPQQGGSGQAQPSLPPNQTPQPPAPHLSHLAIGSNQAVSYHPANVSVGSPPPTSIPVALSPATSGPIGVMNTLPPSLPSRTSSANTAPINLGALATLSYEQQQQILKFHQQQLMLQQQQQQHQHQQQQQQQHLPHSSAIEHEIQHQLLQQFPAYAALLTSNQPKTPKY